MALLQGAAQVIPQPLYPSPRGAHGVHGPRLHYQGMEGIDNVHSTVVVFRRTESARQYERVP